MIILFLVGVLFIALVEDKLVDVFIMVSHLYLGIICKDGTRSDLLLVLLCLQCNGTIHCRRVRL